MSAYSELQSCPRTAEDLLLGDVDQRNEATTEVSDVATTPGDLATPVLPGSTAWAHNVDQVADPRVVQLFKALGDPGRLRILALIAYAPDGEVCVCDIGASVKLSQPTVSHHLKLLREAGLVRADRRGTWSFYRLELERLADITTWLELLVPPLPPVSTESVLLQNL